ncbi:MAG: response regulator [bacterium]|nr:response regulator [bacterium]
MNPEFQDLIPLFVSEGKRRLETLWELASQVSAKPAAAEARRELHTLKGSSRMLNLRPIADLCHHGESLLQEPDEATPSSLTELLDRLSQLLEDLPRGAPGGEFEAGVTAGEEQAGDSHTTAAPTAGQLTEAAEHRISPTTADRLTGGAAAVRLLALTGLTTSTHLDELAQTAEDALSEPEPVVGRALAMLASGLHQTAADLESNQRRLLRHAEDQLERLLRLQLQPLRPFLQNLARHARDLARTLGKEIEVELRGGEARLDQRICSELQGAFLHLVRNAVDHGIETPDRRREAGKRRAGCLRIEATSHGDRVEILVADDGAGIDPAKVLRTAQEAGLVAWEGTDLSTPEILQLLFVTGFSTRQNVSEFSGRGMGLDAVGTAVRNLGGEAWLESELGRGSSIFLEVPAARRAERILVLRIGAERLALPKGAVSWISTVDREQLVAREGSFLTEVEGQLQRVAFLGDLLGGRLMPPRPVLISLQIAGAQRVIAVDEVEGEEEVLLRPFADAVTPPSCYTGITLLQSGEPVAVLAPQALLTHAPSGDVRRSETAAVERLRVLLVEDSLVTREMERRMLEEEGLLVTAVANAEEALSCLGEQDFDCMVTDIEMPGMDGLDLTRRVRGIDRLAQLPIVVVSTRDRHQDRAAGMEAGADVYLSKQILESRELAGVIRRLGGGG